MERLADWLTSNGITETQVGNLRNGVGLFTEGTLSLLNAPIELGISGDTPSRGRIRVQFSLIWPTEFSLESQEQIKTAQQLQRFFRQAVSNAGLPTRLRTFLNVISPPLNPTPTWVEDSLREFAKMDGNSYFGLFRSERPI